MLIKLVLYSIAGCFGEILWTSMSTPIVALFRRHTVDVTLPGQTYLWMVPIYGFGGLVFEVYHGAVAGWVWPLRGLAYMVLIFVSEWILGWLIYLMTGKIPWDYTGARFSVRGLIRIDYAPLWFGVGLMVEVVERCVSVVWPGIAHIPFT